MLAELTGGSPETTPKIAVFARIRRIRPIGIGQYDAAQARIEAEDYFDAEKAEIKECPVGGFEVRGLQAGSRLVYPNVHSLRANATLTFCVASGNPAGGTIEIRESQAEGPLLGTCAVPATGGWDRVQVVSCDLQNRAGTHNLCLAFKGGGGELMRLDWLKFSAESGK